MVICNVLANADECREFRRAMAVDSATERFLFGGTPPLGDDRVAALEASAEARTALREAAEAVASTVREKHGREALDALYKAMVETTLAQSAVTAWLLAENTTIEPSMTLIELSLRASEATRDAYLESVRVVCEEAADHPQ